MIPIILHVPAKKLDEIDSNTNDNLYFNSRIKQSNNVSYKYNSRKYELNTHKNGINQQKSNKTRLYKGPKEY